eukprot:2462139-Rhodomonas_salina.1
MAPDALGGLQRHGTTFQKSGSFSPRHRDSHMSPLVNYAVSCAGPTRCPVLTYIMGLCGSYALPGTDVLYGTTSQSVWLRYGSRSVYTVSSQHVLQTSICLRACYAMSGTDLAYGATRHAKSSSLPRRGGRSPDLSAYALATRCPVLTSRMELLT